MSKLIVLSNRVNLPNPDNINAGGLAIALQDALHDIGGIWIGWNGSKVTENKHQKFQTLKHQNVEYHTCALTESQYQGYYCGFANNTLWPLMHEQTQYVQFQAHQFKIYKDINLKFAKHLQKVASAQDVIWIHDYHFLSVAHYCRQLGMRNRIGFFLHIPFPNQRFWADLAPAQELFQHLSSFDVLGFQTPRDQENCLTTLENSLAIKRRSHDYISYNSRQIQVKCYPIGVHPEQIQKQALSYQDKSANIGVQPLLDSIHPLETRCLNTSSLPFEQHMQSAVKKIISVDRIDYSKGLLEKIQTFNHFLHVSPEFIGQYQQLQIACPCRLDVATYQRLYQDFKQHVEVLNDPYSDQDWQPFICCYKAINHDALMTLYRQADICWVNSIRDGMNLVAKEYMAAQDPFDPGVLILSKYTGAAEQMHAAILVDPYDPVSTAKALKKALKMPKSERLARYQYLIQGLNDFNISHWRDAFLADLRSSTIVRPNTVAARHRQYPLGINRLY